jgi:hypothetical protein
MSGEMICTILQWLHTPLSNALRQGKTTVTLPLISVARMML